jgi:NADH:ubiquinone oxidoreductase subunit 6 (subunit J)
MIDYYFKNFIELMLFRGILVVSVSLVFIILGFIVLQSNPVSSVFSFVLVIVSISWFLRLTGAELFSIILLIIYAGVVSVLFLFTLIIQGVAYNRFYKLYRKDLLVFRIIFVSLLSLASILSCFYLPCLAIIGNVAVNNKIFVLDIVYLTAVFNDY